MFVKFANAKVIGVYDHRSRTAGKKLSSFDYEPRKDGRYLYAAVRACTADVPNLNYDMLPHSELKDCYKTFIGAYNYLNHDNQDPAKARGAVIDAKYHDEDPDDRWIECLIEMDEDRCPKLCSLVRSGEIDTVSMGCNVESTTCSVCGNVAEYPFQYCEHVQQKGRKFGGKLAYEVCNGIDFFELSWVYDPADPTAHTQCLASRTAARSTKTADGFKSFMSTFKTRFNKMFGGIPWKKIEGAIMSTLKKGKLKSQKGGYDVDEPTDLGDGVSMRNYTKDVGGKKVVVHELTDGKETHCSFSIWDVDEDGNLVQVGSSKKGDYTDPNDCFDDVDKYASGKGDDLVDVGEEGSDEPQNDDAADSDSEPESDSESDSDSDSDDGGQPDGTRRCKGTNEDGSQCKNTIDVSKYPDEEYCEVHRKEGSYMGDMMRMVAECIEGDRFDYVRTLPGDEQSEIEETLRSLGMDEDDVQRGMDSRLVDLEDTIDISRWAARADVARRKQAALNLDNAARKVNSNYNGLWNVKVEIEDDGDSYLVWLIDYNEFLSSDNYTEDWIWRAAIYPVESAVQKQTGDQDFYFEPYDYAGRFCGRAWKKKKGASRNPEKFARNAGSFATAPRIPDEVDLDSENAEACPLCGDPNFDGEFCNVCGYEEPPEGFGDIELEDMDSYEEYEEDARDDDDWNGFETPDEEVDEFEDSQRADELAESGQAADEEFGEDDEPIVEEPVEEVSEEEFVEEEPADEEERQDDEDGDDEDDAPDEDERDGKKVAMVYADTFEYGFIDRNGDFRSGEVHIDNDNEYDVWICEIYGINGDEFEGVGSGDTYADAAAEALANTGLDVDDSERSDLVEHIEFMMQEQRWLRSGEGDFIDDMWAYASRGSAADNRDGMLNGEILFW